MWGADEAEGCSRLNGVEPPRVQLLHNVGNVMREQNWVISEQEAAGRCHLFLTGAEEFACLSLQAHQLISCRLLKPSPNSRIQTRGIRIKVCS